MKSIFNFIKKETVLCVSGILAIISMFFITPSIEYIDYIDFRVLSLLFCLMIVVSGMKQLKIFDFLAIKTLSKIKTTKSLTLLLVLLCFFCSMFITNDVALITFVPFTILILSITKDNSLLIPIIVLQTIAANLGSMLTPIGNPQNLYLYNTYSISFDVFLLRMLPIWVTSLILIIVASITIKSRSINISFKPEDLPSINIKKLLVYFALFIICLLCVLRIIPFQIMLAITVIIVILVDYHLLFKADYMLLLTFIFFFIFIGNISHIDAISNFFADIVQGNELFAGIISSQFISNVPAAILLSAFTTDGISLLYGVNIGGLGTLIASLASVISFKFYCNTDNSNKTKYLSIFTVYNIIFMIILITVSVFF